MTDALATAIDRTSQAIALVGADRTPWLFTRCWLHGTRFEEHGWAAADLDAALADFTALPADWPGRAKLAATLVVAQLRAGVLQEPDRLAKATELSQIAQADPEPLPDWPPAYAVIRAAGLMNAGMDGAPGFRPRAALVELEEYAAVVGDLQPHVTMIDLARLALRHLVAQEDNSPSATAQVTADVRQVSARYGGESPLHDRAAVLDALMRANAAALRGDMAGAAAALDEILRAAEGLPAGDHLRVQIDQMRQLVEPLLRMVQPGGPAGPGAWRADGVRIDETLAQQLDTLQQTATLPGLSDTDQAMRLSTLATAELGLADPASLDSAVRHLEQAVEVSPEHDPRRVVYVMSLGMAHLRRFEVARRPADLSAGTAMLEQARTLAGSPFHYSWTLAANPLAHAYRLSGRRELGRRTALDGLRGHAWTVLLQSGPRDAQDAARHAAEDAVDVARWCLEDNAPQDAVAALDAGRGLILYAATETRELAARLRKQDHGDLAAQWERALARSAPHDVPSELRRRVVSALAGIPLNPDGSMTSSPRARSVRLLDPPSLDELRVALKASGNDALVYLVPGDDGIGAAVVVPVDDAPSWLPLPGLKVSALAGFDSYLAEAGRAVRGAGPRPRSALAETCDWAWEAAMGPLLEDHLALPPGRAVRLVLIPMGELARVPWHAARHRVAGRYDYALHRTVFSYAVSGRMLCESAWRKDVLLTGAGLLVGDPDTDGEAAALPAARAEATAIRDAFYPDGRYVGRDVDGEPGADGAGTRAEVEQWLADPAGGEMIHLSCHAVLHSSAGAEDSSYLLLAGGEHLSAEDLIRTLTDRSGRDLALAVLAACSSAESGRGYDEAFSLGTAFLASNARSVISAQWSVPDTPTSVLMFMLHHFLRVERLRPMDALREAQLWMIQDRQPPDTMPAELSRRLATPNPNELAAWAAFVHTGR